MKSIIRNCSHNSHIVLSFIESESCSYFVKSSSNSDGQEVLSREYSGWHWYLSKVGQDSSMLSHIKKNYYSRFLMPFYCGETVKERASISAMEDKINLAAYHYVDIWPQYSRDSIYPIHGDFSIYGNIIFNGSKIHVIDWEHFRFINTGHGIDFLYLVLEILYYCDVNSRDLDKHERYVIQSVLSKLVDNNMFDPIFKERSFSSTIHFIKANKPLWGKQYSKLPVLNILPQRLDYLDRIFSLK